MLGDESFHRLVESGGKTPLILGGPDEREVAHGYFPPAERWTSSGKSSSSCTCRISMTSPESIGARRAESIASSRDRTWIIQKPPTISFASANGPSVTRLLHPANLTHATFRGGVRPSRLSGIPAFF